jgi:16S rRNA (guanine966-N2)-methyltransferase
LGWQNHNLKIKQKSKQKQKIDVLANVKNINCAENSQLEYKQSMNIISGEKRGSKLAVCTSKAVRPTAQRTREALFNILQGGRSSLSLDGATVIDLFAGTGAIGLEALSRGAGVCTFVEQDRDALKTLQTNIRKLKFNDRSAILAKDARQIHKWTGPCADLIFADPPYDSGLAEEVLDKLFNAKAVSKQALVVVETRKSDYCQLGTNFVQADSRVYGMARLSFFYLAKD